LRYITAEKILQVLEKEGVSRETVTRRPISDEGFLKFGNWISKMSWDEIYKTEGTHSKASLLQEKLQCACKSYFPEKTSKHDSADRAYITKSIKTLILEKRRLFHEGKCEQARKLKNKCRK